MARGQKGMGDASAGGSGDRAPRWTAPAPPEGAAGLGVAASLAPRAATARAGAASPSTRSSIRKHLSARIADLVLPTVPQSPF